MGMRRGLLYLRRWRRHPLPLELVGPTPMIIPDSLIPFIVMIGNRLLLANPHVIPGGKRPNPWCNQSLLMLNRWSSLNPPIHGQTFLPRNSLISIRAPLRPKR